jgi:hypothetical protein
MATGSEMVSGERDCRKGEREKIYREREAKMVGSVDGEVVPLKIHSHILT